MASGPVDLNTIHWVPNDALTWMPDLDVMRLGEVLTDPDMPPHKITFKLSVVIDRDGGYGIDVVLSLWDLSNIGLLAAGGLWLKTVTQVPAAPKFATRAELDAYRSWRSGFERRGRVPGMADGTAAGGPGAERTDAEKLTAVKERITAVSAEAHSLGSVYSGYPAHGPKLARLYAEALEDIGLIVGMAPNRPVATDHEPVTKEGDLHMSETLVRTTNLDNGEAGLRPGPDVVSDNHAQDSNPVETSFSDESMTVTQSDHRIAPMGLVTIVLALLLWSLILVGAWALIELIIGP